MNGIELKTELLVRLVSEISETAENGKMDGGKDKDEPGVAIARVPQKMAHGLRTDTSDLHS